MMNHSILFLYNSTVLETTGNHWLRLNINNLIWSDEFTVHFALGKKAILELKYCYG